MKKIDDGRTSSKYEALLQELGFELKGVYDDMVFFGAEDGFGYSLSFDDSTPKYLSIGFGIAGEFSKASLEERYEALQYVSEHIKFVKVYFDDTSLQYSCEQIVYGLENLRDMIGVAIDAMHTAHRELLRIMSIAD